MRHVLALLFIASLTLAAPAAAREDGIRATISDQISAFRDDDLDAAYGHAAPGIQRLFGSPQRFADMVRGGYPMVWRPQAFEFLGLREEGGRIWQRVMFTGPEGGLHILDYDMREIDGVWRIGGVVRVPGAGA